MRKVQAIVLPFTCAVMCVLGITSVAYANVETTDTVQDQTPEIIAVSGDLSEEGAATSLLGSSESVTHDKDAEISAEPQQQADAQNYPSQDEQTSNPEEALPPETPAEPSEEPTPEDQTVPSEKPAPETPSQPVTPSEPKEPKYVQQYAKIDGKWYYFDKTGKNTGEVFVSPGWMKCEGVWYWFKNTNAYAENEWVKANGSWYYLGDKGHMLTGNQLIEGKRYYLCDDGSMLKGVLWQKVGKTWYYVNYGGSLTTDTWRFINHKWYYFDEFGRMKTGWVKVDNKWYYLNSSGAMSTGWQKVGSCWYFLRSNGIMHEGWGLIGGKWYYLQPSSGHMRTNWIQLDNKWYLLSQSGNMLTGWQMNNNKWYLLANNGVMQTGWHKVNGKWYFMNQGGSMKANTWYYDEHYKHWYYFESSGRMNESADTELHNMIETIIDKHTGRGSDALQRAFAYTVSYPYRNGSLYPTGDWGARYAKQMYVNGSGNCYRYAGLFCWIARGLGYKANAVSGWVPGARVAKAPHGWVEVYINGKTYICDPDLAHEMPGHNWYMVTYANAPTYYHSW